MQGQVEKMALLSFKRRQGWVLPLSATTWWESIGKVESDFLKVHWYLSGGNKCIFDVENGYIFGKKSGWWWGWSSI